jgi:hypothetical protein
MLRICCTSRMQMRNYTIWLKQNALLELDFWKYSKVWGVLLLTAFVQYIHVVSHNLVYYLTAEYHVYGGTKNQLVDMGFKAFDWAADLWFWPNFCLYFVAALGITFTLSIFFTRKMITNPNVHTAHIAWRACVVACIVLPLRCISFLITILPAPANHCSLEGDGDLKFNPPKSVGEIFTIFDVNYGCGDLYVESLHIKTEFLGFLVGTKLTV